MNDRTSTITFLAGAVTGAALALLLAPESGGTARGRIGKDLRDAAESARDLKDRLVQQGGEIGEEVKRRVEAAGSALAGQRPRKTHGNGDEVAAT